MTTTRLCAALVAGCLLTIFCAATPAFALELEGRVTNISLPIEEGIDGVQVQLEMIVDGQSMNAGHTFTQTVMKTQGSVTGYYSFQNLPSGPNIFYVLHLVNLPFVAVGLEATTVLIVDPVDPANPSEEVIDPATQMPSAGPIPAGTPEDGRGGASFPLTKQGGENPESDGDLFGLVYLDVGTCDETYQEAIDELFDPAVTQPLLDNTMVVLKFILPAIGGELMVPVTAATRPGGGLSALQNFVFEDLLVGLEGDVTVELSLLRGGVAVGSPKTVNIFVEPEDPDEGFPAEYDFTFPRLQEDCQRGSISGVVFDDTNENGSFEPGTDTPRDGLTVRFFDVADVELGSAVTAGGGLYDFEVPEYDSVRVVLEGSGQVPQPSAIVLVPGTAVEVDFAITPLPAVMPPAIAYASPQSYPFGEAIAPLAPSSTGGPVDGYRLLSPLPEGLVLNPNTGVISGIPTTEQDATGVMVRATNAGGTNVAALQIAVPAEPACQPESCDFGALHEVELTTAVWVGDAVSSVAVSANLYETCRRGADVLDVVSLGYAGTSFPGPVTGLDEVLSLEDVNIAGGWATVRLRLTANPRALRNGSFGAIRRRLLVAVNGRRVVACPRLRCESVRPGGHLRGWGGSFGVLETWSHDSWSQCEGIILPPPPPPRPVPPICCQPPVPPRCCPQPAPAYEKSAKTRKSGKSKKSAKSKKAAKSRKSHKAKKKKTRKGRKRSKGRGRRGR